MSLVVGGVEDKALGFVCFRESETKNEDFTPFLLKDEIEMAKVTLK